VNDFEQEVRDRIDAIGGDGHLLRCADDFMRASRVRQYSYNVAWMARPIIQ